MPGALPAMLMPVFAIRRGHPREARRGVCLRLGRLAQHGLAPLALVHRRLHGQLPLALAHLLQPVVHVHVLLIERPVVIGGRHAGQLVFQLLLLGLELHIFRVLPALLDVLRLLLRRLERAPGWSPPRA